MNERTLARSEPDTSFERALRVFLSRPTVAGWEALLQAIPADQRPRYAREASFRARTCGVDPTLLFHCLLRTGPAEDLLALIESGAVEPSAMANAAQSDPGPLKALWWALAAESAQARGQPSRAELLLHRALFVDADHPGVRVIMGRMARRMAPRREVA